MLQTPAPPIRTELRTLGCRLNQAESDEIRARLGALGVEVTNGPADVVVVNTCTVTEEASRASRKLIRRSIAERPEARIVVTGCYAVAAPEEIAAIPGVDAIVPNGAKEAIASWVAGRRGPAGGVPPPGRIRSNLKIQTGCDEACSFCIVPLTRGGLCSRSPQEVVDRARALVDSGTKEVILTGVHLGKYGRDANHESDLAGLITELVAVDGLEKIRLSSIEATQVGEHLVELMATEPKVCRHLHLPLQTGDRAVWLAMRRPGTLDRYLETVRRVQEAIDDVSLTTDVMVGFPGEDERAFLNTMRVVEHVGFRKLHVFRFSPRPGTPAGSLPGSLEPGTVRNRSERLRRLGEQIRSAWIRTHLGQRVSILVEGAVADGPGPEHSLSGLTDNYLRVRTRGTAPLVGSNVDVLVASAGKDSVEGEVVGRLPVLQDR